MSQETPDPKQTSKWYRDKVRPVFEVTETAETIRQFDNLAEQLDVLESGRDDLFPICLLGQAGVGKSTLLNTLVADTDIVVPSGGGTGPLTANALRVIYGEQRSFAVLYHGREQLGQTRFIIEAEIHRQSKGSTKQEQLTAEEADLAQEAALDTDEDKKEKVSDAIGRAKLLIAGSQTAERELSYLSDALRHILGQKSKFQTAFLEDDMVRLGAAQAALKSGSEKKPVLFSSTDNHKFTHALHDHACGFLAPLIREMTIHWPSELLRAFVEIVDLPGIGILSDAYASVTSDYLRSRAKAVMLVADSRGLRKEDAEILRSSGFLNRLLYSIDNPEADPVALIVVVVKIDDVAVENWQNDKSKNNGTAHQTKEQHFIDQVERCRRDIAERLSTFLRDVWDAESSDAKTGVIDGLIQRLQVFPVSAPQYRLQLSTDPDDNRPFLRSAEATNIPALREAISNVALDCLAEREKRRQETNQRFFDQLRGRLGVLIAQRDETQQTQRELEEFARELDAFLQPLQREFDNRKGGFRNFLRETVPANIQARVESASTEAKKGIRRDLRALQDAHWKTLQAAVRKEGTFYGRRHINLPHDFALRFESPVAEVWGREILTDVRKKTREFADYESGAVSGVLNWARRGGVRTSTKLLEALLEDVKQRRQHVNAVGKEAIEELRDKVRSEMIKKIEGPIRRKCKKFVEDEKDFGRGVKARILELFDELAEFVVEAAAEPARELLVQRFKEVDKEILEAFGEHTNPIDEARDALLQRREAALRKNDEALSRLIESAEAETPGLAKLTA